MPIRKQAQGTGTVGQQPSPLVREFWGSSQMQMLKSDAKIRVAFPATWQNHLWDTFTEVSKRHQLWCQKMLTAVSRRSSTYGSIHLNNHWDWELNHLILMQFDTEVSIFWNQNKFHPFYLYMSYLRLRLMPGVASLEHHKSLWAHFRFKQVSYSIQITIK